MSEHSSLLRPTPRRNFDFTPPSTGSSAPRTPSQDSRGTATSHDLDPNALKLSDRTRSILNLTSSTLFGIYSPSDSSRDGISTPWGPGAETPAPRSSVEENRPPFIGAYRRSQPQQRLSHPHLSFRNYYLPLILRAILLFFFGVAYGSIVTHLHDNHRIAPVKVEGIERYSWRYLAFWGVAGVILGKLLPWVDIFWEESLEDEPHMVEPPPLAEEKRLGDKKGDEDENPDSTPDDSLAADWNPAVRSIGAFVGIAFAIRRLPWQSTLQVSLTLALVNPALWYLIDRSKPGFILSTIVGIAGTAILLGFNPSVVPAPPTPSPRAHTSFTFNVSHDGKISSIGFLSDESIAVSTWIASVLFCSSVCFGNIGRRLSLGRSHRN